MIARGDLAIDIGLSEVPSFQLELIKKCAALSKPVIVATQMLESMIENPSPTRAEINDIATAIFQGADAVMLSAESAIGKNPTQSVKTMSKTILSSEKYFPDLQIISYSHLVSFSLKSNSSFILPPSSDLVSQKIALSPFSLI